MLAFCALAALLCASAAAVPAPSWSIAPDLDLVPHLSPVNIPPPPPVPVNTKTKGSTNTKKPKYAGPILGPPPPHFVAYTDESAFGIPHAKDLEGFNTLILSFFIDSGPADQAAAWAQLPPAQREALRAEYTAHNITLLVSAFGSTEAPTTDGKDPVQLARRMAAWVRQYKLDGIDVDYEDFKAVSKGTAVAWLETFTRELRRELPAGDFVLTHAPVAPWFAPGQPYSALNHSVGHLVDWYNVQFYSQGTAYTACPSLVHASGGDFPGTSLLEIVKAGVPQEKLVIGKPADAAAVGVPGGGGGGGGGSGSGGTQEAGTQEAGTQEAGTQEAGTQKASGEKQKTGGGKQISPRNQYQDGSGEHRRRVTKDPKTHMDPHINGFLETETLAQCVLEAKNAGWNGGVMVWEFPQADKQWIQDVRALAWPYKNKVSN